MTASRLFMCDINKKNKKKETAEKLLLLFQKILINACIFIISFFFLNLFRKDRQRFSFSGCDSPR